MREIPDIDNHLSATKAQKFIDIGENNTKDDEAQELLSRLKEQKVPAVVSRSNLMQVCPHSQVSLICFYNVILHNVITFLCRLISTGKLVEHVFLLTQ